MELSILKTLYRLCNFGTATSCGEEVTASTCVLLTLYRVADTTEDGVEAVQLPCNLAKESGIAVPPAPSFFLLLPRTHICASLGGRPCSELVNG